MHWKCLCTCKSIIIEASVIKIDLHSVNGANKNETIMSDHAKHQSTSIAFSVRKNQMNVWFVLDWYQPTESSSSMEENMESGSQHMDWSRSNELVSGYIGLSW